MKDDRKKVTGFWNSFARNYDQFINKRAREDYDWIIVQIIKELSPESEVLEIGSGTGLISFPVARHVKHLTAIDTAGEMIKIAREKQGAHAVNNLDFITGDANQLDFPTGSFDNIIAVNVLHLLQEPSLALQEMHRVLKGNGRIVVPTYCHGANLKSHFISRMMNLFGFRAQNRWSEKSFRLFIESHNFTVLCEKTVNGTIPLSYISAVKS